MADPALVEAWARGRSLARGLPQPVWDRGALRVDTKTPEETVRWVFPQPSPSIRAIASAIDAPGYALKLVGPAEELARHLVGRWRILSQNYFMTCADPVDPPAPLPPGYRLDHQTTGVTAAATITHDSGEIAARGQAAEVPGAFVYNNIVTDPRHRRLGLGSHVMAALAATRRSPSSTHVLAATHDGHALYSRIGWSVLSRYSTATIPMCDFPDSGAFPPLNR